MTDSRLPRAERLRGKTAIDSLFAGGRSGFVYPFRYVWTVQDAPEEGAAPVSVLVVAPKRNHKRAVKRNLLKRRTREAYRLNKSALIQAVPAGRTLHLALIYSSKEVEPYQTIEDAVRKIIAQLAAGISRGRNAGA
ncbi:MAG: ribonuclease P protein component [Rikenellaceae bacterium]|jgi:ribonuclease P protein component|nr:ribonuclease P protein component [Rikenellaceae bacterium]